LLSLPTGWTEWLNSLHVLASANLFPQPDRGQTFVATGWQHGTRKSRGSRHSGCRHRR
jgi:hypothetical protein